MDALFVLGVIVVLVLMVVPAAVRIVSEWERGVVLRLGRFVGVRGPGVIFLIPYVEQMRKIDLAALVESLCTDMDELGEPVSWETHAAAPLNCRPNEIRRAVRNLIENAVAYGTKAAVRLDAAEERYQIIVEDEGPGIPVDDRARVFEPFVRLEASRSTETGGSGLGLTLVKVIAEGHGGTIELENKETSGLRARLSLPRAPAGA